MLMILNYGWRNVCELEERMQREKSEDRIRSQESCLHLCLQLIKSLSDLQHHGCQTETIGDNGEHHGKIKASRTEICEHSSKVRSHQSL